MDKDNLRWYLKEIEKVKSFMKGININLNNDNLDLHIEILQQVQNWCDDDLMEEIKKDIMRILEDLQFNINQILREELPSSFRVPLRKKINMEIKTQKQLLIK